GALRPTAARQARRAPRTDRSRSAATAVAKVCSAAPLRPHWLPLMLARSDEVRADKFRGPIAMLYAFALLAAVAQPTESRANLPDLFAAVCLDGQARLSPEYVTKIKFDDLPSGLKQRLANPTSGDVWQVGTSGRTYLYALNYPDAPGVSPKICGLA